MIDTQNDVAQAHLLAPETKTSLRNDSAIFRLVVFKIRSDGAIPVNFVMAWAVIIPCRTIQAAFDRLLGTRRGAPHQG